MQVRLIQAVVINERPRLQQIHPIDFVAIGVHANFKIVGFSLTEADKRARHPVRVAGFNTTPFPANSAGIASSKARINGKFQGLMMPTTPTGE